MSIPDVEAHRKAYAPGSVGDIHRQIRAEGQISRAALARATGLSPSTISSRVDELLARGLICEVGEAPSQGGRRARELAVNGGAGYVAVAVLGAHHIHLTLSDLCGERLADAAAGVDGFPPVDLEKGPAAATRELWDAITLLAADTGLDGTRFLGGAISIPAPIEYPAGRVATPTFMPSWNGAALPEHFARLTERPMLVENDANLVALSEREGPSVWTDDVLAVKIGSRIGAGILIHGELQRGISGAAGELGHSPVLHGTSSIPCLCPVENCLESVAGGGALVTRLRGKGVDVTTTQDLVDLEAQRDPDALEALRVAGTQIGVVVAAVANVLNPRTICLHGSLSRSPNLVQAVRAEIYQDCLPIIAEQVDVRTSRHPLDAETAGGISLILDEVLDPARINEERT